MLNALAMLFNSISNRACTRTVGPLRPLEDLQPSARHPAAALAVLQAHLHSDPNRAACFLCRNVYLPLAHTRGRQDVRFRYSCLMDFDDRKHKSA